MENVSSVIKQFKLSKKSKNNVKVIRLTAQDFEEELDDSNSNVNKLIEDDYVLDVTYYLRLDSDRPECPYGVTMVLVIATKECTEQM